MNLDFRIDWGYQMLYSRRLYHPAYNWDGHLETSSIDARLSVSLLNYPNCWWAFCYDPIEVKLETPAWEQSTRRRIAGIHVIAECDEKCQFKLVTASGIFHFSAKQIIDDGRISFYVGPKYGFCSVNVTRNHFFWFRPQLKTGQARFDAFNLPLKHHHQRHFEMAILSPESEVSIPFELNEEKSDHHKLEVLCHLQGMILSPERLKVSLPAGNSSSKHGFTQFITPDGDCNHVDAEIDLEFCVKNIVSHKVQHYFRFHDMEVLLLEDVWGRLELESGQYEITLKNLDKTYSLHIVQLVFEPKVTRHLQLTLPKWALVDNEQIGRIFAVRSEHVAITIPALLSEMVMHSSPGISIEVEPAANIIEIDLQPGWNEFKFTLTLPMCKQQVIAKSLSGESIGVIDAVYKLKNETPEVMVGFDMTVVPHDDFGDMDWLLDYTFRTQLANTVLFRAFRPYPFDTITPSDELCTRWGKFCKDHHIYVQSVNCHFSGALSESAGKYMHNGGLHEYTGVVYASDPTDDSASDDMRAASERFVKYLKENIDKYKNTKVRHAYGDSSGGSRYAYMAGSQYSRVETMVSHTQHICSLQRPTAEIFGGGDWGVHIAIQHSALLYQKDWHLGMYYLSLLQPWVMGASNIYEEDSLFILFKEVTQGWDDALTKGKRDMTREFLRFVKTHPRDGKIMRSIASIEGRYAAPFNGISCGPDQDPSFTVWGKFGNKSKAWGHGQPEKAHQLLDILMPGASTHPFKQDYTKRRFFFSGTPFGDFDQVPIEADSSYFEQYKLMLNLGWNTLVDEDLYKLRSFVRQGGKLFTGLPQFSTHIKRDFLIDMADLALYNNGDLSEFCGIKILGCGEHFSGQTKSLDGTEYPAVSLSREPSFSQDEDGLCHLAEVEVCGAEIVMVDATNGKPLLVKNQYGNGIVYTLTAWCYPGHEDLGKIVASILTKLCQENLHDINIEQAENELFWNVRNMGGRDYCVMLLNTDWSNHANIKKAKLITPRHNINIEVKEREVKIIYIFDDIILEPSIGMYIERTGDNDEIIVHGVDRQMLKMTSSSGNSRCVEFEFLNSTLHKLNIRNAERCLSAFGCF